MKEVELEDDLLQDQSDTDHQLRTVISRSKNLDR